MLSTLSRTKLQRNHSSDKDIPRHNNDLEHQVLDPITHLPLTIHDVTDVELEQIPPPISNVEDRQRTSALTSQQHDQDKYAAAGKESNRQHHETEKVLRELTHGGWWQDPGADLDRARMQAAVTAGVTAGVGAMSGLIIWWFIGRFTGHYLDWFILPLGCCLLAILVGTSTLSFKILQTPPDKHILSPESRENLATNQKPDPNHESFNIQTSTKPTTEPTFPESSTAWLNSLLRSIWPIINPKLFTPISDTLEDSLQHSLPKLIRGVRIADIGQGIEPVRILNIHWLSPGSANQPIQGLAAEEGDFTNLELALAYRAKPTTSTMGLRGRSANIHLLMEFYLSGGIVLPVWVELTGFLATARLRIQLTPNPPFVAMTTLTLLGQPKITMNCTPLAKNFLNVMDVPGISGWLQRNVDSVVGEYVAPKSINLDLKSMLLGVPKMDVDALGVLVVTIRCASGFKTPSDSKVFKPCDDGQIYATLGWSKWGKFLWATRIISKEENPVWEETTAVLVNQQEVDAQESLRVQVWDADRLTADDLIGTIDIPLFHLMHSSSTINQIAIREDQFHANGSTPRPGKLLWECGYFEKTTLQQHLENHKDGDGNKLDSESGGDNDSKSSTRSGEGRYEEVKAGIEVEAEKKLREAETREMFDEQIHRRDNTTTTSNDEDNNTSTSLRSLDQIPTQPTDTTSLDTNSSPSETQHHPTNKLEQQKNSDLKTQSDQIITSSHPSTDYPSGILSIRIEQISGLGILKTKATGVEEDIEDDEGDDLPSCYCTVLINHQRVYKTRTKMKSSNPFFDAKTEKFIRSWENTTLILSVHDNRLHESHPILGVIVLPLSFIFHNQSNYNHTLPIVGGIGYGRLKFSLIFRSVRVVLPKRLVGWDVGTLEVGSRVFASLSGALRRGGDAVGGSDVIDEGGGGGKLPRDLSSCRLVFRTRYTKAKMFPVHPTHYHASRRLPPQNNNNNPINSSSDSTTTTPIRTNNTTSSISLIAESSAQAEWRPSSNNNNNNNTTKPIRLPILKRYASHLEIHFRKRTFRKDTTIAKSILWLKDIPDEDEVTVQLPITQHRPTNTSFSPQSQSHNQSQSQLRKRDSLLDELQDGHIGMGNDDINIPGIMLVVKLRFWHGLSGYHQSLITHDHHLKDVMEVLDCAEEQSQDLLLPGDDETDEEEQSSSDRGGDDDTSTRLSYDQDHDDHNPIDYARMKQEREEKDKQRFVEDANAQRKRPKELHRKHRGLMQWKVMRNMALVGHGVEDKAEKLGHRIKSGFKHQDRETGVEKEV